MPSEPSESSALAPKDDLIPCPSGPAAVEAHASCEATPSTRVHRSTGALTRLRSGCKHQAKCVTSVSMPSTLDQIEHLYGAAVVHAAWVRNGETAQQHLIFCMVELLPTEIPPPPAEAPLERKTEGGTLHLERLVIPVAEARGWYEACRGGACPPLGTRNDPALLVGPLADEPPWPELALFRTDAPFVPALGYDARVHHLLTLAESESFPWPSLAAKDDAVRCMSEWFHFDLDRFDEYLGSLTLVAHNPILRRVSSRPSVASDGEHVVLLRLEKRLGSPIDDVAVLATEERPTTQVERLFRATFDATHELRHGREEGAVGVSVYHSDWGLLYTEPALHFMKSVGVNVSVPPPERVVTTRDGKYVVSQRLPQDTGRVPLESATHKLNRAANARKSTRKARTASQYIATSAKDARKYVRRLIHGAEHQVCIVDPYFRESDLEDFALAVGSSRVQVRVLGSALGFQDQRAVEPAGTESRTNAEQRRAHAARLENRLEALARSGLQNSIEVRIMPGRRAPYFHDRFLIADEDGWSLGSSLSELGERVSAILQLPDPRVVRGFFDECWAKSALLAEWIRTEAATEAPGAVGDS